MILDKILMRLLMKPIEIQTLGINRICRVLLMVIT